MIEVNVGDVYGRLTVIKTGLRIVPNKQQREKGAQGNRAAMFQCECENTRLLDIIKVVRGNTTSCGCYRDEVQKARAPYIKLSHGLSYHPIYGCWKSMMARCTRPWSVDFYLYGARGIQVHEPWHDVSVFIPEIISLIGERPEDHSLDRIDNDGNYEPGNIKWSSAKEQANNRRPRERREVPVLL